jgi:membrane protease YdiL (CAAX protease family)
MTERSGRNAPYGAKPSLAELVCAVLTGVGHVTLELACDGMQGAAESLNRPQHVYNLAAVAGWGAYLLWRLAATRGRAAAAWGFRRAGFFCALRDGACFAAVAAIPLIAYGVVAGHWPPARGFWLVLALYPLWGLAQQFALQALVTRNLRDRVAACGWRTAAAATLFACAHFPNVRLMLLTFVAGCGFTWIFEKHRNLWAVGIVHGVLGALAYYLVLGADPGADLLRPR